MQVLEIEHLDVPTGPGQLANALLNLVDLGDENDEKITAIGPAARQTLEELGESIRGSTGWRSILTRGFIAKLQQLGWSCHPSHEVETRSAKETEQWRPTKKVKRWSLQTSENGAPYLPPGGWL